MLADEASLGRRSSLVGSDVCKWALDKAQAGVYGRWSMRSTTEQEQAAHFHRQDGGFAVADHLRRRTTFVQRNLLDGPPAPGLFHVVLCRNLLIYLTRDGVQRAAAVLTRALTVDGWLLTGASDPPLAAPGLERVRTPYGLAYRRVEARDLAPTASAGTTVRRSAGPQESVTRKASSTGPRASTAAPLPAPVHGAVPQGPAPAEPTTSRAPAQRVRQLGDAGRLAEALAAAEAAAQPDPLDVELRYLAGVLLFEAGRLEQAAEAATAAVFLGPDEPAAHLLLGQVQHAAGGLERARRSFRNAARLAAAPSELPVALAPGVPAGHLAAVAGHYLDTLPAPR